MDNANSVWKSRCSGCGLWVRDIDGVYIEEEFVCVHCLHESIDLQIEEEESSADKLCTWLPPVDWFI